MKVTRTLQAQVDEKSEKIVKYAKKLEDLLSNSAATHNQLKDTYQS